MWASIPPICWTSPTTAPCSIACASAASCRRGRTSREWRQGELAYYQGEKVDIVEDLWNLPDGRILRVTRQRHPLGGVLLLFKDITDELSLKAEFNRLINVQKATLDNLREAVVVFSADGRLRLHNDAFAELWELKKDTLADAPDFDAVVDAAARASTTTAMCGRRSRPA